MPSRAGRARAHDGRGGDRVRTGRDAQCASAPRALQRDPRAVDRHVQIVGARPGRRRPAKPRAARLPDLQVVLRVERERVADDDAAARAERQAVDVRVLREVAGHAVGRAIESDRRIADRQPADLRGRGHVAFDERRRDAEHVGDVVEARRPSRPAAAAR